MAFVSALVWLVCVILSLLEADDSDSTSCTQFEVADLPTVDVGLFLTGDHSRKIEITNQFDQGFHDWGAVRLINHSISSNIINDLFHHSSSFFNQENDFKSQFATKISDNDRLACVCNAGYNSYRHDIDGNMDCFAETFCIFNDWDNITDIDKQTGNVYSPKYMQLPPQFRSNIPQIWTLYRHLLSDIHWIASVSLGFGLNENIFETNMTKNAHMNLRIGHYFELDFERENKNDLGVRLRSHEDFFGFSFVNTQFEGLQLFVNETWYDILPESNSIIVIGGKFIERWTNKHWKTAKHRVVYNDKTRKQSRISLTTFSSPNMEADIGVLPCEKCMQNDPFYENIQGMELVNALANEFLAEKSVNDNCDYKLNNDGEGSVSFECV